MIRYDPPTEDNRSKWYKDHDMPLAKEQQAYFNAYKRRCYNELATVLATSGALPGGGEPDKVHATLMAMVSGAASGAASGSSNSTRYAKLVKKLEDVGLVTSDSSADAVFECITSLLDGNMELVSNQSQIRYLSHDGVYDQDINAETIKVIRDIGPLQHANRVVGAEMEVTMVYEIMLNDGTKILVDNEVTNRRKLIDEWFTYRVLRSKPVGTNKIL
jgi:hypothetical protein